MYFDNNIINSEQNLIILNSKTRLNIKGFKNDNGLFFIAGDIVKLGFEKGPIGHIFEGICLSIHQKNFGSKNCTFLLRNVIMGVGVELNISYYMNRAYKLEFNDFKRKNFNYKKPRLYYLRIRLNRESKIK